MEKTILFMTEIIIKLVLGMFIQMKCLIKIISILKKKLKIELPYDPAIPLLGIYLEKTIVGKHAYTPVFITALFTIAKTWRQLNVHYERTG